MVDDEVTKTAFDCINSTIIPTCIDVKWAKILEAKKAIEKGAVPNQDLVSTISALAMEDSGVNLTEINKELLKRYSSNSNVP
jgi:hypothetical protein